METMINGVMYKYTNVPAFGPKILSYVNCGSDEKDLWINDTETKLTEPITSHERFLEISQEIDYKYN